MTLKQKRHSKIFIIIAMISSLTGAAAVAAWPTLSNHDVSADKVASYEIAANVVPLSPAKDAVVGNTVTIQFYSEGLQASQFEPFWSVDNGTWNRMNFAADNPQLATQQIDVSKWNWRQDKTYTITMTALIKGSWKPVQTSVTIKVDPVAAAAAQAAATAKQVAPVAALSPAASAPSATVQKTISAGQTLFTDGQGEIFRSAVAAATADPANAAYFNKLANTPVANWYGGWNRDVQADVNNYVSRAAAVSQVPVVVAYNIPMRDQCGSFSAGGAAGNDTYRNWIRAFAAGIGQRSAIVILEPDALADMDCMDAAGQANRSALLSEAVTVLQTTTKAQVYLDAGNPGWVKPNVMAKRLKDANVAAANGFALNVSNFFSNNDNIAMGNTISSALGGKQFVIDTSRNGNGPTADHAWCNPAGRAVGQTPTLQTNNSSVDAYLWIKGPGGSDGDCVVNGVKNPPAGVWSAGLALDLLRN